MENKINILLIENQERQFQIVSHRFLKDDLSDLYQISPNQFQYIKFIDAVRIWVNENYSTFNPNNLENNPESLTYRELAMKHIIQMITDNKIEIILMDYKLGAGYFSHTGIELAKEINEILEQIGYNKLPFIFISKDQKNKIIEQKLKSCKLTNAWIHKGFFGDEILQDDYIKEEVLNGKDGVKQLLNANKDTVNKNDLEGGVN